MISFYYEGERRINRGGAGVQAIIIPDTSFFDPSFTEVIIFMTAEEAESHPPHVIAAWPNPNMFPGLIEGYHWALARTGPFERGGIWVRENATWERLYERFGVNYPLTKEDFVINWEAMNWLWWSFTDNEREIIYRAGRNGYLPQHVLNVIRNLLDSIFFCIKLTTPQCIHQQQSQVNHIPPPPAHSAGFFNLFGNILLDAICPMWENTPVEHMVEKEVCVPNVYEHRGRAVAPLHEQGRDGPGPVDSHRRAQRLDPP